MRLDGQPLGGGDGAGGGGGRLGLSSKQSNILLQSNTETTQYRGAGVEQFVYQGLDVDVTVVLCGLCVVRALLVLPQHRQPETLNQRLQLLVRRACRTHGTITTVHNYSTTLRAGAGAVVMVVVAVLSVFPVLPVTVVSVTVVTAGQNSCSSVVLSS